MAAKPPQQVLLQNGSSSTAAPVTEQGQDHSGEQTASMMLYVAVICACFSPFVFGYTIGYTSPVQSTMEGETKEGIGPPGDLSVLSVSEFSLYASLLNIGAVVGALTGGTISERIGRKKTLMLTAVPHLVGWIGSAFASNAFLLIALRILIGWGVGVGSAVTPVYIGEIATTGLRGALGAANQLSVTGGIFFVNLAGTYVFLVDSGSQNFVQWRYMCFLAGAIALLLCAVAILPESPKWLASQGKPDECRTALARLRSGDSSMEADAMIEEMQRTTSAGPGSARANVFSYKKSLIIGVGLCVFQQVSGVNAVMMYTSNICESAGMPNANQAAMIVMGLQVILTGISCLLMERAGRRMLLLFGSFSMSLASLVLAYSFLALDHKDTMSAPSWLAISGLVLFIVGFSLALGPIPWLILAELFPTEVRSNACSIACGANWSFSFLVTMSFLPLEKAITKEGTFLLFGIISALCFLFVLVLVPETKGKTVDEVLIAVTQQASFGLSLQQRRQVHGASGESLQPQVVSVQ